MYNEWKLTDQELARLNETGGSRSEAQEAKKQAFIKAGGIILNPDALPDLYEACKEGYEFIGSLRQLMPESETEEKMAKAINKANGQT